MMILRGDRGHNGWCQASLPLRPPANFDPSSHNQRNVEIFSKTLNSLTIYLVMSRFHIAGSLSLNLLTKSQGRVQSKGPDFLRVFFFAPLMMMTSRRRVKPHQYHTPFHKFYNISQQQFQRTENIYYSYTKNASQSPQMNHG